MKPLRRPEKTLLIALILYSLIPTLGGALRISELAGAPVSGLPDNPRALAAPFTIGMHILCSAIFCVAGTLQFLPGLTRSGVHRVVGRAVAVSGCLSAATGLWMTHFFSFSAELQSSLLYGVRIIVSLSMIGLIARGFIAIRKQHHNRHGACMLRAYAIGQGASTQAVFGIGWMIFTGSELEGLTRDALMVISWALNLVVAEWVIRKVLRRHTKPQLNGVACLAQDRWREKTSQNSTFLSPPE